jgi:hypothetical protein
MCLADSNADAVSVPLANDKCVLAYHYTGVLRVQFNYMHTRSTPLLLSITVVPGSVVRTPSSTWYNCTGVQLGTNPPSSLYMVPGRIVVVC